MVGSTYKGIGVTLAALASLAGLTGCNTRVSANVTTNAPVQYSHVYVTISQVWVNASATAGPDDTAWIKATLDTPQTIDLLGFTNGALKEFASQLPVPTGTYNQARLFFVDTDATLASSAQSAGAQFNNEVDYFDSANVQQRARLAVPNAANGVAVPIKLDVQTAQKAILAALGSGSSTNSTSSSSSNSNTTNPVCNPSSASYNPTLCNQQSSQSSQSSTTNNTTSTGAGANGFGTTSASAAVVFDAGRDITRFAFDNAVGFALNPRFAGYDLKDTGTI